MQPTSRMTFKFDGNLPREVRNDSTDQQASDLRLSSQGGTGAALADPTAPGFKPRGFSAQSGRQSQNIGSGYRLPGKGAHIGQGRPSPEPAVAARTQAVLAEEKKLASESAQQNSFVGNHSSGAAPSGIYPQGALFHNEHPPGAHLKQAKWPHNYPNRSNLNPTDSKPADSNRPYRPDTQRIESKAHSKPALRDVHTVAYQDDVEGLEQMIRGTDWDRDLRQTEGRSVTASRLKSAQPGRVAGFRKPSSVEAPLSPALPHGDDRRATAGPLIQAVYPPADDHDPYALNHTDAYGVRSIHAHSEHAHSEMDMNADERWMDGGETRRYRGGPSWMRIFASIAAAILTGAIFGYIVLALFTGEPILPTGSAADPASAGLQPGASGVAASGSKADLAATGKTPTDKSEGAGAAGAAHPDKTTGAAGDAQVPASVSYLLQYGVFQSEASMNEAVQALTSQGIAAATDTTDGYRVYAGIASGKNEAEKLAAVLTDEELYAKALDNRALSLPQTPAAVSWAAFLEESDALGRLLAGTSAELLEKGGNAPPSEQSSADLQAAWKRWKATTADMTVWSGSRSDPAGALAAHLEAASGQWTAYVKEPSAARMRAVQASTMKAALIARQLREELGEDGD